MKPMDFSPAFMPYPEAINVSLNYKIPLKFLPVICQYFREVKFY